MLTCTTTTDHEDKHRRVWNKGRALVCGFFAVWPLWLWCLFCREFSKRLLCAFAKNTPEREPISQSSGTANNFFLPESGATQSARVSRTEEECQEVFATNEMMFFCIHRDSFKWLMNENKSGLPWKFKVCVPKHGILPPMSHADPRESPDYHQSTQIKIICYRRAGV